MCFDLLTTSQIQGFFFRDQCVFGCHTYQEGAMLDSLPDVAQLLTSTWRLMGYVCFTLFVTFVQLHVCTVANFIEKGGKPTT